MMFFHGFWFDRRSLDEGKVVWNHACDGWLPGAIKLEWTNIWCSCTQFACNREDLFIRRHRTRERGRVKLAHQARNGLGPLGSHMSTGSCDMFCYGTQGEVDYVQVPD